MSEARLERLAELIATSPHNLVARGERNAVRSLHIDECAALAALLPVAPGAQWVDLGTGGGLPGLVLAILEPGVDWTLVDSTAKKVTAVRGFASELSLDNVTVLQGRAETLAREPGLREGFDGVVCRAVDRLVVVAELSRGFLRDGGVLAAVKGPRWHVEVQEATPALAALRFEAIHSEEVEAAARPTWLVKMRATGAAPERFPRRVGVPHSRPLAR